MGDLLPGTTVQASDTPVSQVNVQDNSYTCTNTGYGTASTGGTYVDCAVVFTAPTTGRVKITLAARLTNTVAGNGTLVCTETRTGNVVGSGTIVDAVADRGPSNYSGQFARMGAAHAVSGLTPNATYNCRVLHKVTAGTGSIALRELIVEPMT